MVLEAGRKRGSRRFTAGVAALLAACAALQVFSIRQESQTWDEAIELASGYRYLKTGEYRFFIEHPPLGLVALPLLFLNPALPAESPAWGAETHVHYGATFLHRNRVSADILLFAGRMATILATLALGLALALWVRRAFGQPALFALALHSGPGSLYQIEPAAGATLLPGMHGLGALPRTPAGARAHPGGRPVRARGLDQVRRVFPAASFSGLGVAGWLAARRAAGTAGCGGARRRPGHRGRDSGGHARARSSRARPPHPRHAGGRRAFPAFPHGPERLRRPRHRLGTTPICWACTRRGAGGTTIR